MTQQMQLPSGELAHATIVGLHKQACFGRLQQYGIVPENEKEAAAMLDLGMALLARKNNMPTEKAAEAAESFDYGNGPFAQALDAFHKVSGPTAAPGFEHLQKKASVFGGSGQETSLPPALIDSAYETAYQLAHDPTIYGSAIVKRAMNEHAMFEHAKAAGIIDDQGNPVQQSAETEA